MKQNKTELHICKYCGISTTQPDETCYKANNMKKWSTRIYAKHNVHGEMREFIGPLIEAPTAEIARQWCVENAGWLHITGDECVAIVDAETGKCEDFETTQNN